jgi:2-aminoadipate transaminase
MTAPGPRQPRSAAHEIERYAALFADRTKVMKSSAMRDLMALTAREDVISFSGGLPDTSTFPPGFFTEIMSRVASEACAKALQYGPPEGLMLCASGFPTSWLLRAWTSTPI